MARSEKPPRKWTEDAEWSIRFDDKARHEEGRRAKIWHFEGYGVPADYHWTVKESFRTHAQGSRTTLAGAESEVMLIAKARGWL